MLKNEVYIGNVVSGKRTQVSPKVKKGQIKPKSEYIIVKNKHEPIINNELWTKTQEKLNANIPILHSKHEYLLKGITYCGKCGGKIIFQTRKRQLSNGQEIEYVIARCENKYKYGTMCSNSSLGEKALLGVIKEAIMNEIKKIDYSKEEIMKLYYNAKRKGSIDDLNDKIIELSKKLKKVETKISDLYFQKLDNMITLEQYNRKKDELLKEKERLEKIIDKKNTLLSYRNNTTSEVEEMKKVAKLYKNFIKEEIPSKEMIKELIEKIIVTDKTAIIEFKHKSLDKETLMK